MSVQRDSDGFVVPAIPGQPGSMAMDSAASNATPDGLTRKELERDIRFRHNVLRRNHIFLLEPNESFPPELADLPARISADRTSPGLTVDSIQADTRLHLLEDAMSESAVEQYFSRTILLPSSLPDCLKRSDRQPMNKYTVPQFPGAPYSITTPVPDMLYGYPSNTDFMTYAELMNLAQKAISNGGRLIYPFLSVEFKGEGGSLWVATNQCIGGLAACVNTIEQLHRKLLEFNLEGLQPHDRVAYGIALNGTEARIYVSWLHSNGQDYQTKKIRSFCLQEADHYIQFRCYVNNILEWGKTTRLQAIFAGLDRLLASEAYMAYDNSEQLRSHLCRRSRPRVTRASTAPRKKQRTC